VQLAYLLSVNPPCSCRAVRSV